LRKYPLFAALLLVACFCAAQKDLSPQSAVVGKIENIQTAPEGVSAAVRQELDTKGYRLLLDDGSVACEIWLRKSVPSQAQGQTQGTVYPRLSVSTLVAVVNFPQASTDYRGQAIAAGVYTLRYALQPDDGNHLGTSPTRDFLLLIPGGSDSDPKAVYKFAELVELSRKATGTKHPGVLNLVEPTDGSTAAIIKDDEEHWIFSAGTKLDSGSDLAIALVVKGTAPQ
jgi:hypothetical protein